MSIADLFRKSDSIADSAIQLPKVIPNYSDLDRITEVATYNIAGGELKIIGHKDVPTGEIHVVQNGRCTHKIINTQ